MPEDLYSTLSDAGPEARLESWPTPWESQFSYRSLLHRRRQRELREREEERYHHALRARTGLERGPLPGVSVPLRLAEGERACYASEAALCGEYTDGAPDDLPVLDRGLLVLTDRRLIYLGRGCQILLSYEHLLRVSHLPGAVAFLADTWRRRAIFSLKNAPECLACLQQSLFQFQSRHC
jgi:hypothetical protein